MFEKADGVDCMFFARKVLARNTAGVNPCVLAVLVAATLRVPAKVAYLAISEEIADGGYFAPIYAKNGEIHIVNRD
jgi:hypothetical protein